MHWNDRKNEKLNGHPQFPKGKQQGFLRQTNPVILHGTSWRFAIDQTLEQVGDGQGQEWRHDELTQQDFLNGSIWTKESVKDIIVDEM